MRKAGYFDLNFTVKNSICPFYLLTTLNLLFTINTYATEDYDTLLMSENTTVALCGDLNYKRQNRDCHQAEDLKQCLELNDRDPLFTFMERPHYSCVNSSYSAGVKIIKDKLVESEQNRGCLAYKIRGFFERIVDGQEFLELSRQFSENLGAPLILTFGIDIKENLYNLQMDPSSLFGPQTEMINIDLGPLESKSGQKCQLLSMKKIINKLNQEISKISLKVAAQDYNYYHEDAQIMINNQILDNSRSNLPSPEKKELALDKTQ